MGNKTGFVNKAGNQWTYEDDAAGRLVIERTPQTNIVETSWSGAGDLVVGATKSVSMVTRNVYDGLGNLVARTEADGQPQAKTTRYVYDAAGRQIRTCLLYTSYTPRWELAKIEESGGRVIYLTYDIEGNHVATMDSNGIAMSRTYDSGNRVLTETLYTVPQSSMSSPAGPLVTRNVYDASGRLRFQLSPEGNVTEYRYNARGEQVSTLTYAGDVHPLTGFGATNAPSEAQMVAWAASANLKRVGRVDARCV